MSAPDQDSRNIKIGLRMRPSGRWIDVNGILTVGRSSGDLIFPDDARLSTRHCRFFNDNHGLSLIDLGSSNGTFINGERAEPGQKYNLAPGFSVAIGDQQFVVSRLVQRNEAREEEPEPDEPELDDEFTPTAPPVSPAPPAPPKAGPGAIRAGGAAAKFGVAERAEASLAKQPPKAAPAGKAVKVESRRPAADTRPGGPERSSPQAGAPASASGDSGRSLNEDQEAALVAVGMAASPRQPPTPARRAARALLMTFLVVIAGNVLGIAMFARDDNSLSWALGHMGRWMRGSSGAGSAPDQGQRLPATQGRDKSAKSQRSAKLQAKAAAKGSGAGEPKARRARPSAAEAPVDVSPLFEPPPDTSESPVD